MITQRFRALAVRDHLRESFDDGRLAHTGFADEHRIVLLATRQHFHHALDFLRASDGGIELAFGGKLREVATEVVERGRLATSCRPWPAPPMAAPCPAFSAGAEPTRSALRHLGAEQAQRFRAGGIEIHAGVGQDLRRDALLLTEQAKQQMLGADVAVVEIARFGHRQFEHLLGAGRVRQIGAGGLQPPSPS